MSPTVYQFAIGGASAVRSLTAAAGGAGVAVAAVGDGIPVPSGSIRYDTRAGGAQDIQAGGVTTLAQATTASGFNAQNGTSDGASYTPFFTTDADGAGSHAWGFPWKDYANGVNGEHDQMIWRGMGSLGIGVGDTYIQWKVWQGKTASGGGVGSNGSWMAYGDQGTSANSGGGKRLVWLRAGDSNSGRLTLAPGNNGAQTQIFIDSGGGPGQILSDEIVDWNDYNGQWLTITMRIVPSSDASTPDGTLEVWLDGFKIHSDTALITGSLGVSGELRLGGPTWIDPPQDQTMYLKDVVVWQP